MEWFLMSSITKCFQARFPLRSLYRTYGITSVMCNGGNYPLPVLGLDSQLACVVVAHRTTLHVVNVRNLVSHVAEEGLWATWNLI